MTGLLLPSYLGEFMRTRRGDFLFPVLIVLFSATLFCSLAVAQSSQPVTMPGTGAPLLVTPEIHLGSPVPRVGATNATAGNTAGASNSTANIPLSYSDPFAVPLFAGSGSAAAYTPDVGGMTGVPPSTPIIHLASSGATVGATTATLGNSAGAATSTATLPVVPRSPGSGASYNVAGSAVTVLSADEVPSSATRTLPRASSVSPSALTTQLYTSATTVGASNATTNMSVLPSVPGSLEQHNAAWVTVQSAEVVPGTVPTTSETGAAETAAASGASADLLVGQSTPSTATQTAAPTSLADAARQYRKVPTTVKPREFTNDDLQPKNQ